MEETSWGAECQVLATVGGSGRTVETWCLILLCKCPRRVALPGVHQVTQTQNRPYYLPNK